MVFISERNRYAMSESAIVYIESRRNGSVIHGNLENYPTRRFLSDWSATLSSEMFFRCHEGFIVNLFRITGVNEAGILLDNGRRVPVSRRRRGLLLQKLSSLQSRKQVGPGTFR